MSRDHYKGIPKRVNVLLDKDGKLVPLSADPKSAPIYNDRAIISLFDDGSIDLNIGPFAETALGAITATGDPTGAKEVNILRDGLVVGTMHTSVSGATARLNNNGTSSLVGGWAGAYANGGVAEIKTDVGFGNMALGTAWSEHANSKAYVTARNRGQLAMGYSRARIGGTSRIDAQDKGSFALGYALANGSGYARIRSNEQGSFAMGMSRGSVFDSNLDALGQGSFALGLSFGETVDAGIFSTGGGSLAMGFASSGSIRASANGSLAFGHTVGGEIAAAGEGSATFGYGASGQLLAASGTNCFQFGVGSNELNDTVQVGNQLRFKGTDGAPSSPANGDMWVNSGSVYIHTNGVTKNLDNIT